MSLQSSVAVMKAKLAGNVPALQALAMQGDFEAVAALKEMNDKKAYAQSMANETAMQQQDTLPVLEQLVGGLEAPQGGIAAYAGGGEAFAQTFRPQPMLPSGMAAYGAPATREGPSWLDRLLGGVKDVAYAVSPEGIDERLRKPNYGNEGRRTPMPPTASVPAATVPAVPQRKPRYTGIAAVAAPAETSPPSDGPFDPKKRMQRQEGAGMPSLPAAEDQTDAQLLELTEKLTPLQKERDALREKSRAQLEAAYNAKVKNLTPSKFDQVMEFLAGVSAKGGSSAAQALGAGALAMHGKNKERQGKLGDLKEMYDKADMLLQEAGVRDRMNDAEGAYKLRQEAAELQRKIAAQKSTERLQASQAGLADANAAYIRDTKPVVETARANRVGRSGIAGGAGIKPPNPVQIEAKIQSRAAQILKNDMTGMTDAQARAQAERDVRASIAGKPTSPAAPSGGVKFLGFE